MMRNIGIVVLAFLLLGCAGKKSDTIGTDLIHNNQTIDGKGSGEAMPVITFDKDTHDFGRLTAGESVSYSFHFTNTGKSDLVIANCEASCGCTIADYPKGRIAPGKDGYVKVSFKSAGMSGIQYKDVTVATNGNPSRVTLHIVAEIGGRY